ncbi:MAG: TolC family protein [Fibrobacteria bacterium]
MMALCTAWALGPASAAGLALDSLIRMGLAGNAELQAAGAQAEVLAADTLGALNPANPSLSLEAMHNLDEPSRPKAAAKLSQEIRPGYRPRAESAARARMATGRAWQMAREWDLILAIRTDYQAWQILNRKARSQREVSARWEGLARLAKAMVAEGKLSQVDEAQTRLDLAGVQQREAGYRYAMGALEKHLGYLAGTSPLPDSLAQLEAGPLPALPPLDTLAAWAEAANPELRALAAESEAGRSQVELEKALRTLPFNVSLGYERETDGGNLVGAGVEVPLPLFGRNPGGTAKAKASLREADLKRIAAQKKTRADLEAMRGELLSLADRDRSYREEILELGRKQLALAEKGFRDGRLGVFDLSKVQQEVLARELESLDIEDAYYRIWNRLGRAVGGKLW